jgi:DNA-binding response OmpR family regulator
MKLTKKESKVYEALKTAQIVTRPMLLNMVWGYPMDLAEKLVGKTRQVDMTVSRLKRKLPEGQTIETRHGIGYTLKET